MRLALGVATCEWEGWRESFRSWVLNSKDFPMPYFVKHKSIMEAYWEIHKRSKIWTITGYIHDDLVCMEKDWDVRVANEFKDPKVGIVGFAGALGHGSPKMYEEPYKVSNMARQNFISNMKDAERHGGRFTGGCDVVVLDGMALFVRREVLEKVGGWPQDGTVGYFLYSEWICCMARRMGYKIRLVGVACDHLGGKSTGLNPIAKFNYEEEHRWLYENFKDVLPASI